jgi:hypothetical protein
MEMWWDLGSKLIWSYVNSGKHIKLEQSTLMLGLYEPSSLVVGPKGSAGADSKARNSEGLFNDGLHRSDSQIMFHKLHGRAVTAFVASEILVAVAVKGTTFWGATPCISVDVQRRFGETFHLHPQGEK